MTEKYLHIPHIPAILRLVKQPTAPLVGLVNDDYNSEIVHKMLKERLQNTLLNIQWDNSIIEVKRHPSNISDLIYMKNIEIWRWCDENFGPQLIGNIPHEHATWLCVDLDGSGSTHYSFRTPRMSVAFRLRWA